MSWSSTLPQGQSTDMRLYELTQQLRAMQLVQAEQSRRLDEQGYRIHQLEMKDLAGQKLETQRYIWGPGIVGESSRGLSGLGFEVFSPSKEKEEIKFAGDEKIIAKGYIPSFETKLTRDYGSGNAIETEVDTLLLSPTLAPKESNEESKTEETSEQGPLQIPSCNNYFPYILAVQCAVGGRNDQPPTTEADLIYAQINTSVHASFIDSALVHHLGMQHKI